MFVFGLKQNQTFEVPEVAWGTWLWYTQKWVSFRLYFFFLVGYYVKHLWNRPFMHVLRAPLALLSCCNLSLMLLKSCFPLPSPLWCISLPPVKQLFICSYLEYFLETLWTILSPFGSMRNTPVVSCSKPWRHKLVGIFYNKKSKKSLECVTLETCCSLPGQVFEGVQYILLLWLKQPVTW